jgi:carbamate kinase
VSAADARAAMADDPTQAWRETGAADGGGRRRWRRVVPSPDPVRSLEAATIRLLLAAGAVVVANGGGGVAVVTDGAGGVVGADAVIDKDLAGALLAVELDAERFVILTDVPGVAVDYGAPGQRWLDVTGPTELRWLAARGTFGVGSMAPKVEAAVRFVEATGRPATIGPLERAADTLHGRSGTKVVVDERAAGADVPASERPGRPPAGSPS